MLDTHQVTASQHRFDARPLAEYVVAGAHTEVKSRTVLFQPSFYLSFIHITNISTFGMGSRVYTTFNAERKHKLGMEQHPVTLSSGLSTLFVRPCFIQKVYSWFFSILGPFRFVDRYGAGNLVKLMEKFQRSIGEAQFTPCQLLLDHAKNPSLKFHTK